MIILHQNLKIRILKINLKSNKIVTINNVEPKIIFFPV